MTSDTSLGGGAADATNRNKEQGRSKKLWRWSHLIITMIPLLIFMNLDKSFTSNTQSSFLDINSVADDLIAYNDSLRRVPNGKKCFLWEEDSDHWWTHHPMWQVSSENSTHTCFRYVDRRSHNFLFDIYQNQFMTDCKNIMTRFMIDSGWGADWTAGIAMPIQEALRTNNTLTIMTYNDFWHYAALKPNGTNPTCPAKDLTCYFLDLTNCKPTSNRAEVITEYFPVPYQYVVRTPIVYRYVTRPRQWLRREVYPIVEQMKEKLSDPCSVMHVRRADVIFHGENSRKYYPISDYMEKLPEDRRSVILLLTDDSNAIAEAKEFFPDTNWIYFNRTRHQGASGGWENQIPSKSPKQEVITILATLKLVPNCDTIVYGESSFATLLFQSMEYERSITKIRVDEGLPDLVSINNTDSDKKLKVLLDKRRRINQTKTMTNSSSDNE